MIESKAAADRLRGGFFVADAQTASSSPAQAGDPVIRDGTS
jgi:hypothetical protein